MILQFPNADTFRLALTGGFVPPAVAAAPAAVSADGDGRVFVDTDAKLPKKAADDLKRLGVVGARRHPADPKPVAHWLQIVPVERDPKPPHLSSQAAVLFELPAAADMAAVVTEMLRLGNDRQSFRWVAGPDDQPRVLLRVVGPPYYTLLRALDPGPGAVRAYTEAAPRVWVRVGFKHPLTDRLQAADGQMVLVDPDGEWRFADDAPFRDIYEALRFDLPSAPEAWADAPVGDKLNVPLKLVPGNATDAPELWVLDGAAADRLDAFVRDADERVTQRLKFAVGTGADGRPVLVLRTTPSKLAPPVLPLADAVGYKPFWKLPNLYVPAGTRLHPTLRRDVVRMLLADDTDRLVWLAPGPGGSFTPRTLPEDAFRPLEDWVEYVIEANHAPLAAWVGASQFDFEHFVCNEGQPPKPKDKDDKGPAKGRKGGRDAGDGPLAPAAAPAKAEAADGPLTPAAAYAAEPVVRKPSEWEVRRKELEAAFLAADGPLDDPARQALWPELAVANGGYGDHAEAGVCWLNALWEQPAPPAGWLDQWLGGEAGLQTVTAAEFDKRMKPADPTPGEVRQFVVALLHAAHQPAPPTWLASRLPAAQRYLEAHERKLPVRAVWLTAVRLAQLSGADVLGQARVRDRLLQRLLEDGLNPERDLPSFLRFAGHRDSERMRLVREKSLELHRTVRAWAEKGGQGSGAAAVSDGGATAAYVDLLFAWGLAKLGEGSQAAVLAEAARPHLTGGKATDDKGLVGDWLYRALRWRVDQAAAGKPHAGRLDPPFYDELDQLQAKGKGAVNNNPYGMAHYVLTRMQEQSRVLEPQEKLDPYAQFQQHANDPLKTALAALPKERDPALLAKKIRELYRNGAGSKPTPDARFQVLHDALPLSGRAGEAFTVELLNLVPEAMKAAGSPTPDLPKKEGRLLERALFLAAHFDRKEMVAQLVDQFVALARAKPDDQRYELINVVAGQCLRSLRKLGLKDDIDRLLRRLQDEVLKGQTPAQLKAKLGGKPDVWSRALQTLLYLAGGWLSYGLSDTATPILDDARTDLLAASGPKLPPAEYTRLAQAYVAAVGQGPADTGLGRIAELFRKMPADKIANGFTTAKFYSRLHLNLAEETVLAIVSDEFAVGDAGRRWLEEDEYLIRRRIHRDMRRNLDATGL